MVARREGSTHRTDHGKTVDILSILRSGSTAVVACLRCTSLVRTTYTSSTFVLKPSNITISYHFPRPTQPLENPAKNYVRKFIFLYRLCMIVSLFGLIVQGQPYPTKNHRNAMLEKKCSYIVYNPPPHPPTQLFRRFGIGWPWVMIVVSILVLHVFQPNRGWKSQIPY